MQSEQRSRPLRSHCRPTERAAPLWAEGQLRTREFEAKNNGGKRQRTEIVATRVQFLGIHPAKKMEGGAINEAPPSSEESTVLGADSAVMPARFASGHRLFGQTGFPHFTRLLR